MSRWRVRTRTIPKTSAPGGVNQDQSAWRHVRGSRGAVGLLAAVSDGATNAFQSETWARRLVDAFTTGDMTPGLTNLQVAARLRPLASDWVAQSPPRSTAWFHRAFANQGSYATLLGLRVTRRGRAWRWTAIGVGDSVLFLLDRNDQLVGSFPHGSLDGLLRDPMLVATRPEANSIWFHRPVRTSAWFPTGGSILLATDAIARWVREATRTR